MNKIILALMLTVGLSGAASAANDRSNPAQSVITSSVTMILTVITSHTWVHVDTAPLTGSFTLELQNPSTSWNTCCTFDTEASTETTKGAVGKACRVVEKNFGTWSIQRWWRDLTMYCRSLNTVGNSTILATQGK